MATLYTHKDSNIRKTWLLFTLFFGIVIGIGWVISQFYGDPSILYIAVLFSILMNFFSYWYSDRIVLAMTKAEPVSHDDNPELYHIVENLAITAGLPTPKIYIINEDQPNAFATGRNPRNAAIAVTNGLIERLNREELEGVIAHEMSHIGNRDILVSTVAVVLVGFVSIISDILLRSMWFGGGRREERGGQAQLAIMAIGLLFAILAPISAMLIQLAISRKREFLADASGALLTRYPEGLASALEKISGDTTPMTVANNSTSHLWVSDPFKEKPNGKVPFLHKMFMTHPPIPERLKALRGLNI